MVVEIGRLVRDVELKTINTDDKESKVVNNALAIDQGADKVTYVEIVAWNGTAEFMSKYLKKGSRVYIEGELRNKVEKIGDINVTKTFVMVKNLKFADNKKD